MSKQGIVIPLEEHQKYLGFGFKLGVSMTLY
jgi:hypothetical protein